MATQWLLSQIETLEVLLLTLFKPFPSYSWWFEPPAFRRGIDDVLRYERYRVRHGAGFLDQHCLGQFWWHMTALLCQEVFHTPVQTFFFPHFISIGNLPNTTLWMSITWLLNTNSTELLIDKYFPSSLKVPLRIVFYGYILFSVIFHINHFFEGCYVWGETTFTTHPDMPFCNN